jgi:rhodanese-related sulfurtransferase
MTQIQDPAKARAYFENKLGFTTGPVELDRLIKAHDEHIVVVDVRAAEDFAKGHIPGALNLPSEKWENPTGLSKDKTNIVYCYTQTCHLGAKACVEFAGQGYPVMELDGGFEAWKENDLDIEREAVNRLKRAGERLLHRRH